MHVEIMSFVPYDVGSYMNIRVPVVPHAQFVLVWPLVLPEAVCCVKVFTKLSHHVLVVVGASTKFCYIMYTCIPMMLHS